VEGFPEPDAARQQLQVASEECLVHMETAYNLPIDFLWSRSYRHVYVTPPSVVKANRGWQGQSRARTDLSDAELIAGILARAGAGCKPGIQTVYSPSRSGLR
jgi:hypothetical protein